MKNQSCRNIQSVLLVCLVSLVSACATTSPQEIASNKAGEIADETTRKAASETEEGIKRAANRSESARPDRQNRTAALVNNDKSASRQNINARILQREKRVKIKSAASNKSRSIAKLKGGQQVEVLEEKGSWLKVRWQNGEKAKEGWLKRRFVELQ